ncbi:hypothetical protein [Embleya scabrispora]|uniref:hypothetical protein n=1 Tax=Embleya scabrispora TaxID=159449 RepID=UPI00039C10F7|nr:hypothetical protein [Embleya scabrispora]
MHASTETTKTSRAHRAGDELRAFPADLVGEFETHVTVGTDDVDTLARRAGGYGVGLTHIVLARGRTTSQPMLTERATTTLARARERAAALAVVLRRDGYAVTRTKIEAAPWHPGVPRTDADARALGPDLYFEHHLKLVLTRDADLAALAAEVVGHGAHLSHNARRVRADGRSERFVTQRCHRVGDEFAAAAAAALVSALTGYEIASVEREFVVHDDNGALDDGWLDGAGANAR